MSAERRACYLLGAPDPEALVGRDWSTLVASADTRDAEHAQRAVANGSSWRGTLSFRYADEEVTLTTLVAPVSPSTDLMVISLEPPPPGPRIGPSHARMPTPAAEPAPVRNPPPSEERARQHTAPPAVAPADDLSALVSVYDALLDLDDPTAAARSVLQALATVIRFDWAAVLRYHASSGGIHLDVAATYPTPMAGVGRGLRWGPITGSEALVFETGEPSLDGDLASAPPNTTPLSRLPAFGLRSRLLIPLFAGTEVAGLLVLYRADTRAFEPRDGMLAERIARRLGGVITRHETEASAGTALPTSAGLPVETTEISSPPPPGSTPTAPPPAGQQPLEEHPGEGAAGDASFAQSRLESLGELVAGVAHELNNPLTAILGYAQILSTLDGPEREHALRTIEEEAQRAARIVRNLLDFARQRPGTRHPVNLDDVIRRVVDLRRYALEIDEIRVITRLGQVPMVNIDEGQFEQVFLNLLNNAQQALQGRGGEVVISTWQRGDRVYISFADDGPGVPEAMRARIFEPFFTTRDVGHGQGMGLAIAYGVVTHHGGRTWVEDNPAGGATIVIELPVPSPGSVEGSVQQAPPPAPPVPRAMPAPGRTGDHQPDPGRDPVDNPGRRILVVDDEAPVRSLTREILEGAGFEVETATSGQEALRRLESSTFSVIITDLRMPGMDGASLYQQILERQPQLAHRVLFVTGDIEGKPDAWTLDTDEIRYLEKPYTTRQLLDAIAETLRDDAKRG